MRPAWKLTSWRWRSACRPGGSGLLLGLFLFACGCHTPQGWRRQADKTAEKIITTKQEQALGRTEPITVDSAAETLRRRLLLLQDLPRTGPASQALRDLEDTAYWSKKRHLPPASDVASAPWENAMEPFRPTLVDALQIAARNSREFQDAKDRVFRVALDLDLERDAFRLNFTGLLSSLLQSDPAGNGRQYGVKNSGDLSVTRTFRNGAELSGAIAVDLVKVLSQERHSSLGVFGDASISIPLLRGAGRKIAEEPLRQAERDAVYAIYEFEQYKREFAVTVAADYLGVLLALRRVGNEEENYRRLVASSRRARRLSDSGRLPEFQFDQAVQDELRARQGWIQAKTSCQRSLDHFKVSLGLPPDASMELSEDELGRLGTRAEELTRGVVVADYSGKIPPADAPVVLKEPDRARAGALELDETAAVRLALEARSDLRVALGRVEDAQRDVLVAADRLRAELTLLGTASVGESRSVSSADEPDAKWRADQASYSGLLTLNLPLKRTSERNQYRKSLIDLEKAVRDFQAKEDSVKLEVRDALRSLLQARETVFIQTQAVRLAEKRVRSTDLFLQAGRAAIRDVLEAQDALLTAQNSLSSALVAYRVAELQVQRDLGRLEVTVDGLWQEFRPERGN